MESKQIMTRIEGMMKAEFGTHPFASGLTKENAEWVMGNYLAMSQAFPHLQAGAQKDLLFHYMDLNKDVPAEVELTSVVGSFLSWDEWGGHYVVGRGGQKALPQILDTAQYFHSNLLKDDMAKLFPGLTAAANYSPQTRRYLIDLFEGLSSLDHVVRCAAMVAFERHADRMIAALWGGLERLYSIPREELIYFRVHVGGDDPAEAYHVEMTSRLVNGVVPSDRMVDFLEAFRHYYNLNSEWCRRLTATQGTQHDNVRRLSEARH